MRNDGIRPAFACLKIVILETVNILASSSAVNARPIRSIRSGSDIGSAVLFWGLHDCIYLLSGFTCGNRRILLLDLWFESNSHVPRTSPSAPSFAMSKCIVPSHLINPLQLLQTLCLLLISCMPCTVSRSIVAMICESRQCRSGWAFAHVCKEGLETGPPLTNPNSTSAIVWPTVAVWIEATLPHRLPSGTSDC